MKQLLKQWLPFIAILSLLAGTRPAQAASLDSLNALTQQQFQTLVENVAAATHYKAISPAEPLGLLGFDIAAELSATEIDESIFDAASSGNFGVDAFLVPRLHAHKGLPFGLDVGAFYTAIPDTDFQAMGAELRYAILTGSVVTPALAVRLTYSTISGVDEMELENLGAELTISKGFALLTPYAGVGIIRATGTPTGGIALQKEEVDLQKVYAGININLGLNFGLEMDVTGDYQTVSIKAGLRF